MVHRWHTKYTNSVARHQSITVQGGIVSFEIIEGDSMFL